MVLVTLKIIRLQARTNGLFRYVRCCHAYGAVIILTAEVFSGGQKLKMPLGVLKFTQMTNSLHIDSI